MKISFEWRELTDDGLLTVPKEYGPYYDRDRLNSSYDTEEEAIEAFVAFKKRNEFSAPSELVLLKLYRVEIDE